MVYNVKPGDIAVIIDSANGPKGLAVGRKVRVHADSPVDRGSFDNNYIDAANSLNDPHHYCPPSPYEKEHTKLGKIWPVTCINGGTFADENGNVRQFIDVADRWLRKEVTAPPAAKQLSKELEH